MVDGQGVGPISRLVPLVSEASLMGSVTLLSEDETEHFSTGEQWDADR